MSEPLVYEFQMTPEFALAAAPRLEQAFWMRNERLYHHLEARMSYRPLLRKAGIVLCVAAMALDLLGWWLEPRKTIFFAALFAVYGALLLVFLNAPALGRALRRLTRRMVGWNARRTMARVAQRAPYTIRYELGDKLLQTRAEKIRFAKALDLRQVGVAIETPDFICAFARSRMQRPLRVLYVPGAREHAALCGALTANGVEMVRLEPQ